MTVAGEPDISTRETIVDRDTFQESVLAAHVTDIINILHTHQNLYICKDHPRDQQNVVLIHRWSLYAGPIILKVYLWGPVKRGLYKQVVLIYRWSLEYLELTVV